LISQLESDSSFLRGHKLIDYSILLLEVDKNSIREKMMEKLRSRMKPQLKFNQELGVFSINMIMDECEGDDEESPPKLKSLKKLKSHVYRALEQKGMLQASYSTELK